METVIYDSNLTELARVTAAGGPATIVVKRLGWRRLEEAKQAGTNAAFAMMRAFGSVAGDDLARVLSEAVKAAGKREEAAAPPADSLRGYDLSALLCAGVVSCDGVVLANPREATDEFDPDVAQACGVAILRLSRPALFETEEERKNA